MSERVTHALDYARAERKRTRMRGYLATPDAHLTVLADEVERLRAIGDTSGADMADWRTECIRTRIEREEALADAEHWKAMVRDDRNLAAEALENLGRADANLAAACAVIANVRGLNAVLADVETQGDGETELVTCRVVLAADLVDALAGLDGGTETGGGHG